MDVFCIKLTKKHLWYECPLCNTTHRHGNDGCMINRLECRGAYGHCLHHKGDFIITINDKTIKE